MSLKLYQKLIQDSCFSQIPGGPSVMSGWLNNHLTAAWKMKGSLTFKNAWVYKVCT